MFLQLDRVSISYGQGKSAKLAVDGVSMGLSVGQIGVLIGPSGCGKTSLLRAVAGLEPISHGQVRMERNVLSDGDTVTVIKDLKVKGSSSLVKVGTKVKGIRLVEGDHDIDCKIDGSGAMKLKSQFVKKV